MTGACTGTVIGMLAELWVIGMRADVVIDVSAVVMLGVGVEMLADVKIVVTASAIGLECIVKVSYAAEVLAGVWAGAIIGGAPGIGDTTGLTAMMTTLEFA